MQKASYFHVSGDLHHVKGSSGVKYTCGNNTKCDLCSHCMHLREHALANDVDTNQNIKVHMLQSG